MKDKGREQEMEEKGTGTEEKGQEQRNRTTKMGQLMIGLRGRRKEDGRQGTDHVRQETEDGRQGTET
jgi:hypothetical protein